MVLQSQLGVREIALHVDLADWHQAAERRHQHTIVIAPAVCDRVQALLERGFTQTLQAQIVLPELDLQGSAFAHQVWQALLSIPRGATRSYSDIAQQIGQPKASRAVALACARNPIALLIPCHRVIAQHGRLSGYRWGCALKQQLLLHEFGTSAIQAL